MFKCFFHLINAKEESLDLKSIILLVKNIYIYIAFLKPGNPLPYIVNTLTDVGMCGCEGYIACF